MYDRRTWLVAPEWAVFFRPNPDGKLELGRTAAERQLTVGSRREAPTWANGQNAAAATKRPTVCLRPDPAGELGIATERQDTT